MDRKVFAGLCILSIASIAFCAGESHVPPKNPGQDTTLGAGAAGAGQANRGQAAPSLAMGSAKYLPNWIFGVDGGVSQPVGVFANPFNTGFNVGLNAFYFPVAPIGIGMTFGYDRWSIDNGNVISSANKQVGFPISSAGTGGQSNIWSFIPSVRGGVGVFNLPVNLDLGVGYGLYLVNNNIDVAGFSPAGAPVEAELQQEGTHAKSGFQIRMLIGAGAARFLNINFVPIYNIIFDGAHQIQYFNGNLQFNFKI